MTERPLDDADLPALAALTQRCLDTDGGLPPAAEEWFVRRRFLSGPGVAVVDGGTLVAAAALGPPRDGTVAAAGAVDPGHRGRGLGRRLLEWTFAGAGDDTAVVVGSEHVSPDAERLYVRYGLSCIFEELVMRRDLAVAAVSGRLASSPAVSGPPPGVALLPWTDEHAPLFFAAYVQSFADRPGYPNPPEAEWIEDTASEDGFDPAASGVALDPAARPAGFVAVAGPWISQIGVVPAWRGHGLGDALLTRALAGINAAGRPECLLCVATDNAAATALYRRHGFATAGRRARFTTSRCAGTGGAA